MFGVKQEEVTGNEQDTVSEVSTVKYLTVLKFVFDLARTLDTTALNYLSSFALILDKIITWVLLFILTIANKPNCYRLDIFDFESCQKCKNNAAQN